MSDSKSPQVSRILLGILADRNNAVVWMVSIRSLISNSSSPLTKLLWIVPTAQITIVTLMFHNFLSFQAISKYLSPFSLSLIFTVWFAGMAIYSYFCEFSHQYLSGGLYWSSRDGKFSWLSRILTDLNGQSQPFPDPQFTSFLFQILKDCSKGSHCDWYRCHRYIF